MPSLGLVEILGNLDPSQMVNITHPNEVCGVIVAERGNEFFWAEGHSDIIWLHSDGSRTVVPPQSTLPDIVAGWVIDNVRPATPDETARIDRARSFPFKSPGWSGE